MKVAVFCYVSWFVICMYFMPRITFVFLMESFCFGKLVNRKEPTKKHTHTVDVMQCTTLDTILNLKSFLKVLFRLETNVLFRWQFFVLCVTSCVELQLAVVDKILFDVCKISEYIDLCHHVPKVILYLQQTLNVNID